MAARTTHCVVLRVSRVSCQYQRKRATMNAACAWDHDGLKYMYTGSELAHQIATVARNAQRSPTYFAAIRIASSSPRNPYTAVPSAMANRYGSENPSAATLDPSARATRTPICATIRNGAQRIAGPTVK